VASSGKTDITKVGLNSIENETVKANLMGKSRVMNKKGWVDSQGRKGKGYGVYRVSRVVFPPLCCCRRVVLFRLPLRCAPLLLTKKKKPAPSPPRYRSLAQFADKYGANVDGYSPIYTPDLWSESGDSYRLGTKGLIAWAGLVVVLLGVGVTLIVSTSQLGA
jgi:photosystem II 10kDa protein